MSAHFPLHTPKLLQIWSGPKSLANKSIKVGPGVTVTIVTNYELTVRISKMDVLETSYLFRANARKAKLVTVDNVPSSVTSASHPSRTGPLGNRSQTTSSSLATVWLCTSASCSPNNTKAVQIKHGSTLLPPNFDGRVAARAFRSAPTPSNNSASSVRRTMELTAVPRGREKTRLSF